nr:hypothetical protein [Tanacetum cinerariifolium]
MHHRNDASSYFIAEADPEISAPNDVVPYQQGPDEGSKNYTHDHTFAWTNQSVLVDKIKSAGDGSQMPTLYQGVPLAGKSTASPAKGEKNTNPVTEDVELENLADI